MAFYIIKCIRQNLTSGCHGNAFPLLSYHSDTSNRIFKQRRMSAFQKCMVETTTRNGTGNQIFKVWPMDYQFGPKFPVQGVVSQKPFFLSES